MIKDSDRLIEARRTVSLSKLPQSLRQHKAGELGQFGPLFLSSLVLFFYRVKTFFETKAEFKLLRIYIYRTRPCQDCLQKIGCAVQTSISLVLASRHTIIALTLLCWHLS